MIGEVIRQRRLVLNMTQAELAERTGVSAPAVNKWEKGMSCPDVMILPVLARVLKMDMNDLFDFRKEMTVEELGTFIGELRASMLSSTAEELYDRIRGKSREYPGDAKLFFNSAAILNYAVFIKDQINEQNVGMIEELLQETEAADPLYHDAVNEIRVSMDLALEKYDEAEEILKKLRRPSIDLDMVKAQICSEKGKPEEAMQIMTRSVYVSVNEIMNRVLKLRALADQCGNETIRDEASYVIHQLVKVFGLWEFYDIEDDLAAALRKRDREGVLKAMKEVIRILHEPYSFSRSLLFEGISRKDQTVDKELVRQMLEQIRNKTETDEDGFMKDDEELIRLLEEGKI
ncbi:MAG: helix-turn-helix transcriptional regulator [Solobacterium sp.]|nr:helix-turn-helix transcriptional regulator [Solobacterium sp.]